MDKKQFYPTPYKLARKMVDILSGDNYYISGKTILEPSAGDGAILDILVKNRRVQKENIICCEVDYDRQVILRHKGYNIVGFDFMADDIAYTPHNIIMNPPFRNGVNHVIKAWNILAAGGRLVALINASNLKVSNPNFNTQSLMDIIDIFGSVEYLKDEFMDELSRRKTNVEVALITLDKPKSEDDYFLNAGFDKIKETIQSDQKAAQSSALVVKDIIPQLVARYNASIQAYKTMDKAISEFNMVSTIFSKYGAGGVKIQRPTYNEFVRNLTKEAWEEVFKKSNLRNMVSKKVKEELNNEFDSCATIAFNERNINMLLESLIFRFDEIMTGCLLESFDNFTKYHTENREHREGWISNSQWLITKKLIYPAIYDTRHKWYFDISWTQKEILNDLDRALCYLAGLKLSDINTISDTIRVESEEIHAANKKGDTYRCPFSMRGLRSTFFDIKTYKKGTVHLTFNYKLKSGDDIRDRFNYIVAKQRGFPLKGEDVKDRK